MKKAFFYLLSVAIFLPTVALGYDCPRGMVNDPAPGRCGLYVDANKDGYCDLSEIEETINQNSSKEVVAQKEDHKIGLITIILVFGYIAGLVAVRQNKISVIKHRRFWNWLLLIFFVPTLFTSLFLALLIEFEININFGINLSYWHFVFGWAFLLVSVFHIIWHTSYYFIKRNK